MEKIINNQIGDNFAKLENEIGTAEMDQKAQIYLRAMFKDKSYFKEYLPLSLFVFAIVQIFTYISATSSWAYVYAFSAQRTPYPVVVTFSFLAIMHLSQQFVTMRFFKNIFRKRFKGVLFVMFVLINILSTYTAFNGVKSLDVTLSTTVVDMSAVESEQSYNLQIANLDAQINNLQSGLKTNADWNVQNRVLPKLYKTRDKIITNKESRISKLETEISAKVSREHEKQVSALHEGSAISVLSDVFICLGCLYLAYFFFKSAQWYDIEKEVTTNTSTNIAFIESAAQRKANNSDPILAISQAEKEVKNPNEQSRVRIGFGNHGLNHDKKSEKNRDESVKQINEIVTITTIEEAKARIANNNICISKYKYKVANAKKPETVLGLKAKILGWESENKNLIKQYY